MKKRFLLGALTLAVWAADAPAVSYTRLLEQARAGEVAGVKVTPQHGVAPVEVTLRDGRLERSVMPADYSTALALFEQRGVNVEVAAASFSWWNAAPFGLLLVVWLVLFYGMKTGAVPKWR